MSDTSNKDLVVKAITALLVEGDLTALDTYWSDAYVQHNPDFGSGTGGLREALSSGMSIAYEIGFVVGDGDIVMVHGRYTGLAPTPLIAVDIFRVVEGKIAEHWDVLQPEVSETASGNPMFDPVEGSTVAG